MFSMLLGSKKGTISCPLCKKETPTPPPVNQASVHNMIGNATCEQCKKKYYYMNCGCHSVIYSEKELFFGALADCKNCKRSQQIVPCPACKSINLWNGNYSMGAFITCFNCKSVFQQVACCNCKEGNYWISNGDLRSSYKFGFQIECFSCKKKFQHLNCPHCKSIQYFDKLNYTQGSVQTCTSCKGKYQHVNCPLCFYAQFFKNLEFSIGKPNTCNNCKHSYCLSRCQHCKEVNTRILENMLPDYTNKFSCIKCKKENAVISCPSCKEPVDCQSMENTCVTSVCSSCSRNIYTCSCSRCKQIEFCNCGGIKPHSCSVCKNDAIKGIPGVNRSKSKETEMDLEMKRAIEESIRLHKEEELKKQAEALMLMKQFNSSNVKKDNKPAQSVLQPKKNGGPAENKQPPSQEDNMKCKICFDKNIEVAFTDCGHTSCEKCVTDMKKKECPFCRKEGKYIKLFI